MSFCDIPVSSLTNEELRNKLLINGVNVGPIGPSTRKIYEKKLVELCCVSNLCNANHQTYEKICNHDEIKQLSLSSKEKEAEIDYNLFTFNIYKNYNKNINHNINKGLQKDDEEFEESFRQLSPEEVVRLRAKFSSSIDYKPIKIDTSQKKKLPCSKIIIWVAFISIVFLSLIIITKINSNGFNYKENDNI